MINLRFKTLALLLCITTLAGAQTWKDLVRGTALESEDQPLTLKVWTKDLKGYKEVSFLPNTREGDPIEKDLKSLKPNVLSETLMYIPRGADSQQKLALYNSLRRVSTFKDIRFWNWEKEVERVMFRHSFHIADMDNKDTPLEDPLEDRIVSDQILVNQELIPFGDVISQYKYKYTGDSLLFEGTNKTPIKYQWFTAVKPGNMLTLFHIIFAEEFTLIYGLGGVDAFDGFGAFKSQISDPFYYRTNGLFEWYLDTHLKPIFNLDNEDTE